MGWIILGISIGALILILISILLIADLAIVKTYYKRCDGVPTIRYPSYTEYEGLERRRSYFVNDKKARINTFVYRHKLDSYKAVIMMIHGVGSGHTYFMNLIDFLCKNGYIIFTYDQYACGSSEGRIMGSMTQGISDVKYALKALEADEELAKYPLYVFGHSWGGMCAANSVRFSNKIEKVIDVAGIENESMMAPAGVGLFLKLRNFFIYGKYAFYSASGALKKTTAKVMYLQGNCDLIVDPRKTGLKYQEMFKNKKNIEVKMIPEKGHAPYTTNASQKEHDGVMRQFGFLGGRLVKMQPQIVYAKVSELDPEVTKIILDFYA